jgi:hypothetical protein
MTITIAELKQRHRDKRPLTAAQKERLFNRYHKEWWLAPHRSGDR